jgi:hypothetical protein
MLLLFHPFLQAMGIGYSDAQLYLLWTVSMPVVYWVMICICKGMLDGHGLG